MPSGQSHKIIGQALLIFMAPRDLAPYRPVLAEHGTGQALRDRQSLPDVRDARPVLRAAQQFSGAAFFRMSLYRLVSDVVFRSLVFSSANSLSRFTWSSFRPPYSCRHW